jgi:hypothetical protein
VGSDQQRVRERERGEVSRCGVGGPEGMVGWAAWAERGGVPRGESRSVG